MLSIDGENPSLDNSLFNEELIAILLSFLISTGELYVANKPPYLNVELILLFNLNEDHWENNKDTESNNIVNRATYLNILNDASFT